MDHKSTKRTFFVTPVAEAPHAPTTSLTADLSSFQDSHQRYLGNRACIEPKSRPRSLGNALFHTPPSFCKFVTFLTPSLFLAPGRHGNALESLRNVGLISTPHLESGWSAQGWKSGPRRNCTSGDAHNSIRRTIVDIKANERTRTHSMASRSEQSWS